MGQYREVAPPEPLRPFVERLWVNAVSSGHDDRRILPDGRMDLVWIRHVGALIAGPQSRYTSRPAAGPLVAFGARFHPGAAPALLRASAAEMLDEHVPLDAIDARLAARVDARLDRARDAREALEALGEELVRRLDQVGPPDPAVREAVALLRDRSMAVADLAARVFLSERQLQRRFAEGVGYGPKTLQRIFRFQRMVGQLHAADTGLAGLAASVGYADQAHLSRESRRLAGLSPGQLARWVT